MSTYEELSLIVSTALLFYLFLFWNLPYIRNSRPAPEKSRRLFLNSLKLIRREGEVQSPSDSLV